MENMESQELWNWVLKGMVGLLSFLGLRLWNQVSKNQQDISDLRTENGKLKGKIDLVEQGSEKEIESLKELTSQRLKSIEDRIEELKNIVLEKLK